MYNNFYTGGGGTLNNHTALVWKLCLEIFDVLIELIITVRILNTDKLGSETLIMQCALCMSYA